MPQGTDYIDLGGDLGGDLDHRLDVGIFKRIFIFALINNIGGAGLGRVFLFNLPVLRFFIRRLVTF